MTCTTHVVRYKGTVEAGEMQDSDLRILMDNVKCLGYETSITDCPHAGWGVHNCNHSQDVFLSCGTSPVHFGN